MAVKSSDSFFSASLQNEKRVLDQLGTCPQILRCFGDDRTAENGGEIYNLFLEYASLGSLADRIRKSGGGGLPESDVRRFTRSVLKGLCHIHEKGFNHCDIKLGNILDFANGDVKISDFGLAKQTEETQKNFPEEARVEIRGTPLYMAPESVNENVYDSPADIWALGCCVVEMSSGKTAWSFEEGENIMSLFVRIGVRDELPKIPADMSEEGKDFLGTCFVKDPKKIWTAQMLLRHSFVAVDQEGCSVPLSCTKDVSVSPRGPFDFLDWVTFGTPVNCSVSSCSSVNYSPIDSWVSSLEERIRRLVTDQGPDWSVLGNGDPHLQLSLEVFFLGPLHPTVDIIFQNISFLCENTL